MLNIKIETIKNKQMECHLLTIESGMMPTFTVKINRIDSDKISKLFKEHDINFSSDIIFSRNA